MGGPTGKFDPAWAATRLDSPASFDPGMVLELGPFDLDSDGYADILGSRGESTRLAALYGRPDRFAVRNAEPVPDVVWNAPQNPVLPIGDLDGDGFVDFAGFGFGDVVTGSISIYYGGPTRRTGPIELSTPDLQLESADGFTPQATSGDIDGDTFPDLIVQSTGYGNPDATGTIYAVRGTGNRLLGHRVIEPADILMNAPQVPNRSDAEQRFP